MNKAFSATTLALVLAASATAALAQEARPRIELPRMKIDLGKIFEAKEYDYVFPVLNRGNADLVISEVKPGCGCTAATFDRVIPPGGEGKIRLLVEGDRVHGTFEKSAQVLTNDPDHAQMTLAVAGTEVPYVNVVPEGTVYLHGRYGEKIEKSITLSSNEEKLPFEITNLSSNIDDKITYKLTPGPAKGQYTVLVSKKADLPIQSSYGSLFIASNSPNAKETVLQVHVMTKGDITASPTLLNFGQVKFGDTKAAGAAMTKPITVSKTTGPFKIKQVTSNNPSFTAEVVPVAGGQKYQIQVKFTPPVKKRPNQNENAELTILTDDAREPSIRVQVVARSL